MSYWVVLLGVVVAWLTLEKLYAYYLIHRRGFPIVSAYPLAFGFKFLYKLSTTKSNDLVLMLVTAARESSAAANGVVRVPLLFLSFLVVLDPDYFNQVGGVSHNFKFDKPLANIEDIRQLVGQGITSVSGQTWTRQRHIFAAAFQTNFITLRFNYLLESFQKSLSQLPPPSKEWFCVPDLQFGAFANTLLFFFEMDSLTKDEVLSIKTGYDHFVRYGLFNFLRLLGPLYNCWPVESNKLYFGAKKKLEVVIDDIVTRMLKSETDDSLISLMKESYSKPQNSQSSSTTRQNWLNMTEIRHNILLFILGGYETTSATIAFAIRELELHPDVQNKLVEEVNQKLDISDAATLVSSLNDMTYLESVIKETLRLHPPSPGSVRIANQDTEIQNTLLKKGEWVVIDITGNQHCEQYWKDANVFNPDRFVKLGEGQAKAWLPFGYGARKCVGANYAMLYIKLYVCLLLQQFEIHKGNQQFDVVKDLTFHPSDKWSVILNRREKNRTQ